MTKRQEVKMLSKDPKTTGSERTGSAPELEFEFGGKLASRLGAQLSEDRSERRDPKALESETRMAQAARPQNWDALVASLSFDERVEKTVECLGRKNNQKEILSDLLKFCETQRGENEVERFLESHAQFADGYHTASKYVLFMRRTGALEELEYDCEGALVTQAMRDDLRDLGASEEEIEELAVEWRYVTTPAGMEALRRFDPAVRTEALLASQKPSRLASFKRVVEFCSKPRSLAEIVAHMDGDPGLEIDPQTGVMHMQPSAYIGLLDQAGALTWRNGWIATEGGTKAIESLGNSWDR